MRKHKDIDTLTFEGMEAWRAYLSEKKIMELEKTWAGAFRKFIYPLLPVEELAKYYCIGMGRPTKDLRVAMGAVILQQIFNLTDSQVRENLMFNQQWHYGLDVFDPSEQTFSERTLWTVRDHLSDMKSAKKIFDLVTDSMIKEFQANTDFQRMDSVHVHSNMAKLGRIRIMTRTITTFLKNYKRHNKDIFSKVVPEIMVNRYLKEKPNGYFGDVRPGEAAIKLEAAAADMLFLIESFKGRAGVDAMGSFKTMQRVFNEQCDIAGGKADVKKSKEVSPDSVQNPSDTDAGYDGHKGQGYQVQITETYQRKEEKKGIDLITGVAVESADKSDANAIIPAITNMKERGVAPKEMLADTLYGGDEKVEKSKELGTEIVAPTPGRKSAKGLEGFEFDTETFFVIHCPDGKAPLSMKKNKKGSLTARWKKEDCENCRFKDDCITKPGARGRRLNYKAKDVKLHLRREYESSDEFRDRYRYRSGIEATNSRYVQMTGARRVRYRGLAKVEFAETMKALGINMFRVKKFLDKNPVLSSFLKKLAQISRKFAFSGLKKSFSSLKNIIERNFKFFNKFQHKTPIFEN